MKLIDLNQNYIKITDLENMFKICVDSENNYFFNLNETLYLNIDKSKLNIYTCSYISFWPLISYKLYGTTRLAWLLMKINNVQAKDIFKQIETGQEIYYLSTEQIQTVVKNINGYDN